MLRAAAFIKNNKSKNAEIVGAYIWGVSLRLPDLTCPRKVGRPYLHLLTDHRTNSTTRRGSNCGRGHSSNGTTTCDWGSRRRCTYRRWWCRWRNIWPLRRRLHEFPCWHCIESIWWGRCWRRRRWFTCYTLSRAHYNVTYNNPYWSGCGTTCSSDCWYLCRRY